VAAGGVGEQKVAGAVRITIASSLRRLWSSWQDAEHVRRLAANYEQMIMFAQAGLREATDVTTLTVVAVSGGPSEWWVSYEIPTPGMDLTSVESFSDQVQQKLFRLEDMNSPEFAAFARGASNAGSSLQLQSVVILSGPIMQNQVVRFNGSSSPEVGGVIRGTANDGILNNGILISVLLALLGGIPRHC